MGAGAGPAQRTGTEVLHDVSLLLPAGATVAIVGENGAGKTTLVKLLLRMYEPSAGSILVDGTDVRQFAVNGWRRRPSGSVQDFARFEFSAQQAVGVGRLEALDDEAAVTGALERAQALDVLEALPDGLSSQLGRSFADGTELSAGQWQKLALGRSLMRPDPLLLVLDEPTASLDPLVEAALFERFTSAARVTSERSGGVTVIVSHRFSTVRTADLIAVLAGGRVVEVGTHHELMARRGVTPSCSRSRPPAIDKRPAATPRRQVPANAAASPQYHRPMTDTGPNSGKPSIYRFSRPGGAEIERRELNDDESAEMIARELSRAQVVPVVIERFGHVDWEYVTESDERP